MEVKLSDAGRAYLRDSRERLARRMAIDPANDDGGPAFPRSRSVSQEGMTLRDWFAGQALASLAGSPSRGHISDLASECYEIADEMIERMRKYD